jgi:hypothetical protein
VRFAFIVAEKAAFPVRLLRRTLQVSRAGFYAWRTRRCRGRTRTPGRASRSRRSMPRPGSATAARGFTPSWRTVAVARVASAWRL